MLISETREHLLKTARGEAKQNLLAAAFLGWLLGYEELVTLMEDAASQAAAARGAERSSRNVAVLGFACGVAKLKPRFALEFATQLEWSLGRPNFSAGGEPTGVVADPVNLAGIMAGAESGLEIAMRQRCEQWAAAVWKDADCLVQNGGWRRGLFDTLGRRIPGAKARVSVCELTWLEAALHDRGWSDPEEKAVSDILKAALSEAFKVKDGFEAGLRLAAIDWALQLALDFDIATVPANALRVGDTITLALSGGGLRATLFQLGIVAYLANTGQLCRVRGMVSVSGGSILAAHLAVNWTEAIQNVEQFIPVAGNLVRFARSDIRHSVLIPWLWSRLNPLAWFRERSSRSGRLKRAYERHLGPIRLGELDRDELPELAFVATDAFRLERIAFTTSHVARFPVYPDSIESGQLTNIVAVSTGAPLAIAVATSSCFPPLFPRMRLNHRDLGLHFGEYKDQLSLNDGGVIGNLGIEVLLRLHAIGWKLSRMVIVADAERPQGEKPRGNWRADLAAQGAALSQAAIEIVKHQLGHHVCLLRLSTRQAEPPGLAFSTQTPLSMYRTDLDAPSWQECQALLLHGYGAAANELGTDATALQAATDGRKLVSRILAHAGCAEAPPLPTESDLIRSHKRPKRRILIHAALVAVVVLLGIVSAVLGLRLLISPGGGHLGGIFENPL